MGLGELDEFIDLDLALKDGAQLACDRGVGGECFEASTPAASAEGAVGLDGDVSEFSTKPAVSLDIAAAADDAHAESGTDVDDCEIGDALCGAVSFFRQAEGVFLLNHDGFESDLGLQVTLGELTVGKVEVRREDDLTLPAIDEARDTESDTEAWGGVGGSEGVDLFCEAVDQDIVVLGRREPPDPFVLERPVERIVHWRISTTTPRTRTD